MSDSSHTTTLQKLVKIKRIFPDNLQSHFIGHVVAQQQADHFILSFFEIWPPVIVEDTEEERQAAIDQITSIDAKCVARFIVTPTGMREVVKVLSENLAKTMEKGKEAE